MDFKSLHSVDQFQVSACVFSGPSTETNSVKMTNPINSVYGFQASKPTPRQEGGRGGGGQKRGGGGEKKKRQKHVQYENESHEKSTSAQWLVGCCPRTARSDCGVVHRGPKCCVLYVCAPNAIERERDRGTESEREDAVGRSVGRPARCCR